jgi:hypothetical protein
MTDIMDNLLLAYARKILFRPMVINTLNLSASAMTALNALFVNTQIYAFNSAASDSSVDLILADVRSYQLELKPFIERAPQILQREGLLIAVVINLKPMQDLLENLPSVQYFFRKEFLQADVSCYVFVISSTKPPLQLKRLFQITEGEVEVASTQPVAAEVEPEEHEEHEEDDDEEAEEPEEVENEAEAEVGTELEPAEIEAVEIEKNEVEIEEKPEVELEPAEAEPEEVETQEVEEPEEREEEPEEAEVQEVELAEHEEPEEIEETEEFDSAEAEEAEDSEESEEHEEAEEFEEPEEIEKSEEAEETVEVEKPEAPEAEEVEEVEPAEHEESEAVEPAEIEELAETMHEHKEALDAHAEHIAEHIANTHEILNDLSHGNLSPTEHKEKVQELHKKQEEHQTLIKDYKNLFTQHQQLLNNFLNLQQKNLTAQASKDNYHELIEKHKQALAEHSESLAEQNQFIPRP